MNYAILGLILFIIIAGAFYLHISYLNRVYVKIIELKKQHVPHEAFYENMSIAQGSNFSGLAMTAWIALIVAILYFYLLTPGRFYFSYIESAPELASGSFGFLLFGIVATIVAFLGIILLDKLPENHRNLKLTELYSFYSLSKNMKRCISLAIPLLGLSIVVSAYSGTIYPEKNTSLEAFGFMLLIVSATILVCPVLVGRK